MWDSEGKCRWNICLKSNFKEGKLQGGCTKDSGACWLPDFTHTNNNKHTLNSQEWQEWQKLKWFTSSFSRTQTHTHTHTFTSEIYRKLDQCDLQSYCCFNNCLPRHNLRCQNSRHTQPITSHFKGLSAQLHLAARLSITAYWAKRGAVSELTSPSRMPFMDKPTALQENGHAPESSQTNTQT